ncbi:hypothetical protein Nepgr_012550 [Nepenthes gracilis]|uniref:Fe2OG dioxygenase domain-containing protein n=1 Tax=Nepenthes gracilis TaxID=150966 RepID=A0AAD3XN88_NEPGR|nr:hypothetical protein Nepgr_012550 [Nepenthes gracilis]
MLERVRLEILRVGYFTNNGPKDEALWASQNESDGFLRTATDQSKTSVLAPDPTSHGLNNSDPAALVIEQTRNAVTHNKGKPPLLSTDDLVQPDTKSEHKKIEAPVLFRGPVAIKSAISLVPKVHARGTVRTLILDSLSMICGRFSIELEQSGTDQFLVEHERPGYKSLSLSRQSTLWPLEMHSVPPLQNTLGWWCIYATISSSSLEDYKGCRASPGTEDAGVDVSWRYGLGTNLIEENSIPPLRDKIELDIFLKQPMQEVIDPIKCFNPIRVFITIDWRVPIASSSLKDPPRCKMPYLDDRESVQAESANGVASLQTSFVAMWQIAWAAGHCLLYSWACQCAPGVAIIPVIRCFCIYGVLLFWISVFLLIISAQNWWCLHEEYLFLYIMVLSLKTKSRRDFPNLEGISCEPCAYTKTTLERGPLKLTTAYGFGGSSTTSIDRVGGDDRFKVSRLEGFVSNREQSYEDPIEELLYAVFVVASENATVAELAATLQVDLSQLQAAASFACQLGWAVKLIDPASVLQDANVHGSLNINLSDDEDGSQASVSSANMSTDGNSVQQDYSGMENNKPAFNTARVAFIVDANITSYLMMGSVSPGLKFHAVTLYEAGKLGHTCFGDLCKDLSTLEGAKFDGELHEFANHASSLRCVLECLLSGGVSASVREVEGCDGMDLSSVHSIVINSTSVDTTLTDKPEHASSTRSDLIGDALLSTTNKFGDVNIDGNALESDIPFHSRPLKDGSVDAEPASGDHGRRIAFSMLPIDAHIEDAKSLPDVQNEEKLFSDAALENESGAIRRKRNYYVDPLRCEEVDPLPSMFKQIIKRMVRWHILLPSCVPNSCIVNIYDEGDCIPPHTDHHDFLRPFCAVSFLSKCNILFGLNLKISGPGEFSGPVSIPLPVGSVMILKVWNKNPSVWDNSNEAIQCTNIEEQSWIVTVSSWIS